MGLLNDDKYLFDLLRRSRLITEQQQQLLIQKAPQQKQLILHERRKNKKVGSTAKVREPDLVEVAVSFNFEIPGERPQPLSEELIMRAVAGDLGLPFKKLDPLELNLEVVTKTLPKNYPMPLPRCNPPTSNPRAHSKATWAAMS